MTPRELAEALIRKSVTSRRNVDVSTAELATHNIHPAELTPILYERCSAVLQCAGTHRTEYWNQAENWSVSVPVPHRRLYRRS